MKILLIEDDAAISSIVKRGLEDEDLYRVVVAEDGQKGLDLAWDDDFALIIMDLMLPKIDGLTICRRLRENKNSTPILMLTAKYSIEDRVTGFEAGADDYLVKPFHFDELLARVRALIRRNSIVRGKVMSIGDIEIDTGTRSVRRGGEKINLSVREYTLLEALARNEGRPLSRETIQYKIWNNEEIVSNTVDVYISMLRKKLESDRNGRLIHTVYGFGYMLKRSGDAEEEK